jgi:hypothetical protein
LKFSNLFRSFFLMISMDESLFLNAEILIMMIKSEVIVYNLFIMHWVY